MRGYCREFLPRIIALLFGGFLLPFSSYLGGCQIVVVIGDVIALP
jgi:hypothetical protein